MMTRRARSMLFAPANRPDVVAKLGRSAPDAAVIDLEDAVPADGKEHARADARRLAEELAVAHPLLSVYVRVNSLSSVWFDDDIATAVPPTIAGVVVPKVESAADVDAVQAALAAAGLGALGIVAGVETTRAVLHAEDILRPPLTLAYFGAEDYVTDLGGVRTDDGLEVLYARSKVALAARVGGIPVLDQIVARFDDDEQFRRDADLGRSLGYSGKLCIHPRQVALAHAAFSPGDAELEEARQLLDAWERASGSGDGVIVFEGRMVDEPMVARAREVLRDSTD